MTKRISPRPSTSPTSGIDLDHPALVDFPTPVADWIAFLADLLAAELMRELEEGPVA